MSVTKLRLLTAVAGKRDNSDTVKTTVELPGETRAVQARAAVGEERDRLWATFRDYPGWGDDIGALASRRPTETAVVVLEPRTAARPN